MLRERGWKYRNMFKDVGIRELANSGSQKAFASAFSVDWILHGNRICRGRLCPVVIISWHNRDFWYQAMLPAQCLRARLHIRREWSLYPRKVSSKYNGIFLVIGFGGWGRFLLKTAELPCAYSCLVVLGWVSGLDSCFPDLFIMLLRMHSFIYSVDKHLLISNHFQGTVSISESIWLSEILISLFL